MATSNLLKVSPSARRGWGSAAAGARPAGTAERWECSGAGRRAGSGGRPSGRVAGARAEGPAERRRVARRSGAPRGPRRDVSGGAVPRPCGHGAPEVSGSSEASLRRVKGDSRGSAAERACRRLTTPTSSIVCPRPPCTPWRVRRHAAASCPARRPGPPLPRGPAFLFYPSFLRQGTAHLHQHSSQPGVTAEQVPTALGLRKLT